MNAALENVSVVVITKNEQANIARCLGSIGVGADVVVIDDSSTDRTVEVARSLGAQVLQHPFESFAQQRNWALEHADLKYQWVLFLDADEQLTPAFNVALTKLAASATDEVAGFTVCRKTMFLGKWLRYSDGFPVWIMRVVRRGRTAFVDSGHGEVPVPPAEGLIEPIREPIIHDPFSKGLGDWFDRHNRYSTREAEVEFAKFPTFRCRDLFSTSASLRRQTLRNLGRRLPARSLIRFAYQYIWRRGILDGRAGLVFSTLMATYEAMIVAKRRELESRQSEAERQVP